jgi:hypothetical protein
MPSTSLVLLSLTFSSLILHQRLLGFFRFRIRDPSLAGDLSALSLAVESFVAGRLDDGASDVERTLDRDSFEDIESRAERATDRIELVSASVSRGAEVGPATPGVADWGRPLTPGDELLDIRPLVSGSDEEDADGGDSNSGVDGMVPESKFEPLTTCCSGVEMREAFGVGGLL